MRNETQRISFLVSKNEMEFLEEACEYGADADQNLELAIPVKDKYQLYFLYEELDDLAGFVAACANHEESRKKQDQWDKLCQKIEKHLKAAEIVNSMPDLTQLSRVKARNRKDFVFDVWVRKGRGLDYLDRTILRKIQISGTKSLYNFAHAIAQAFGFSLDHCFSFGDNLERDSDSKRAYELFVDIGEEPICLVAKGVKRTKISQAFKTPDEKMLFFFDYGDHWHFIVELKEINAAQSPNLKPVILQSVGEAPLQYPPLEDEFEEAEREI